MECWMGHINELLNLDAKILTSIEGFPKDLDEMVKQGNEIPTRVVERRSSKKCLGRYLCYQVVDVTWLWSGSYGRERSRGGYQVGLRIQWRWWQWQAYLTARSRYDLFSLIYKYMDRMRLDDLLFSGIHADQHWSYFSCTQVTVMYRIKDRTTWRRSVLAQTHILYCIVDRWTLQLDSQTSAYKQ